MIVFAQPIEQYPNHLKFSSVPTITSPDAAFPAANLLTYDPTQTCRSATGSPVITWDFGSARIFNIISLISTNTGPRATILIEGSLNGSAWTTLQASSPFWAHLSAVPAAGPWAEDVDPRKGSLERNHSWFYSVTDQSWRYIRITIADPDAASLTFGRLFVGRAFRPARSYQYGSGFTFDDTGTKERTDQGALALLPGRAIVSANVKMDFISTNELYDYVYEFNYWRQGSREMICCLDVNTKSRLQKNILYATIAEGRRVTADQFEAWSQTWILESI